MRLAELTARLERSESRQAVLDEEGVPLQHWLFEQRRWLEEMSKRIALNRPRLFHHYCTLVEAERQRLGLPPRFRTSSPTEAEPRRAQPANAQMVARSAPASTDATSRGTEAPARPGSSSPDWTIPEYLRTADPLAPARDAALYAVPGYARPELSAAPIPVLHSSEIPEPQAVRYAGSDFLTPPHLVQTPASPVLEPALPATSTPVAGSNSRERSEPPRLAMVDYAELTVLLEQSATTSADSVLARFGLTFAEWFDEVAHWNRQFTERRVDLKSFEDMLNLQRGKSA